MEIYLATSQNYCLFFPAFGDNQEFVSIGNIMKTTIPMVTTQSNCFFAIEDVVLNNFFALTYVNLI